MLAGPHPRSLTRFARRPLACPPGFDGRPTVSPRGPTPARLRASRDGLWPCRPASTGGLPSHRGAPPPLAYALRATAFGLAARLRRAAYRLTAGPHPRSLTRFARPPLACPPGFDGRPTVSPRGPTPARLRASRDGLWPVRPASTGGLPSHRGVPPPGRLRASRDRLEPVRPLRRPGLPVSPRGPTPARVTHLRARAFGLAARACYRRAASHPRIRSNRSASVVASAADRQITRMVSSPPMVPTTSGNRPRSIAIASDCA